MTTKKKAARAGARTALNNSINAPNNTLVDPLVGWFELAKPARQRQQKRIWQRGWR